MLGILRRIALEREQMKRGTLKDDDGKNAAAVALGRLAAGKKKTMTPAALKARKLNAKLGGWPKGRPRKPKSTRKKKI